MTGLLVSVRDANEATQALAGGADLIDIKEPRHGALGAADPAVWQAVRGALPAGYPLSVALGELAEDEVTLRASRAGTVHYAKVGLANCLGRADWQRRWQTVWQRLPRETERVAVAYADHGAAAAPSPQDILRAAPTASCRTLLLDTYAKEHGDLFEHLNDDQLARLARQCREAGIALVLAGSLNLQSLERAMSFAPALIAVRGAACLGDRNGNVCGALVKQIKRRISAISETNLISS